MLQDNDGIREELDDALDLANGQKFKSKINAIKILRGFFGDNLYRLRAIKEVVDRYSSLRSFMHLSRWVHNELGVKE